jgi:hypothetical protein
MLLVDAKRGKIRRWVEGSGQEPSGPSFGRSGGIYATKKREMFKF